MGSMTNVFCDEATEGSARSALAGWHRLTRSPGRYERVVLLPNGCIRRRGTPAFGRKFLVKASDDAASLSFVRAPAADFSVDWEFGPDDSRIIRSSGGGQS